MHRFNSLAFRLAAGAALWTTLALVAAGYVLSTLFVDAVERSFDARLSVLLDGMVAAAEPNDSGGVSLTRVAGEPRFEQPYSGWYWQITGQPGPIARSASLFDLSLTPRRTATGGGALRWYRTAGPEDQVLRVVERDIRFPEIAEPLTFTVAGDRAELVAEVKRFNTTLAWSLGALGLGLVLAVLIQVRFGLQPLRGLQQALAAIRSGRADKLEGSFPVEVTPLAEEMNALLDHNLEVVARARTHVGNLAHALKTPLAVLGNEAARGDTPLAETVRLQTAIMRRNVDHHLTRARAAGAGRVIGTRTEVMEVLDALVRTLEQIHADKAPVIALDGDDALTFRGERHDFEEMAGNLIDNACKWAQRRVRIEARPRAEAGRLWLVLSVDDDGPGLTSEQRAQVFDRGARFDEAVPGSGLGLAIVRDIAALYGGQVTLEDSDLGGLRARLELPAAEG
jgi:signal transduction histidine kinase